MYDDLNHDGHDHILHYDKSTTTTNSSTTTTTPTTPTLSRTTTTTIIQYYEYGFCEVFDDSDDYDHGNANLTFSRFLSAPTTPRRILSTTLTTHVHNLLSFHDDFILQFPVHSRILILLPNLQRLH